MKSRNQQFQQTFEIVHHLLLTVVQAFESVSYASTASFPPLQVSSSECSEKWTFGEHINLKFSLSNCLRPVQSIICNTIWQMKCLCFLISELEVGVQFLCPCWDFVLIWFAQVFCLFVVYFIFLMLSCLLSYAAVLFQKIPFPYSSLSPLTFTLLLPPLPLSFLSYWRR